MVKRLVFRAFNLFPPTLEIECFAKTGAAGNTLLFRACRYFTDLHIFFRCWPAAKIALGWSDNSKYRMIISMLHEREKAKSFSAFIITLCARST